MKILLSLIIAFQTSFAYAECEFTTDIMKMPNGYLYTTDCHKEVGKTFKNLKDAEEEVEALRKNIELKDLAMVKYDQQLMLWRDETYNQHERLLKIKSSTDREKWVWFILGVVVTSAAVHGAGQLR